MGPLMGRGKASTGRHASARVIPHQLCAVSESADGLLPALSCLILQRNQLPNMIKWYWGTAYQQQNDSVQRLTAQPATMASGGAAQPYHLHIIGHRRICCVVWHHLRLCIDPLDLSQVTHFKCSSTVIFTFGHTLTKVAMLLKTYMSMLPEGGCTGHCKGCSSPSPGWPHAAHTQALQYQWSSSGNVLRPRHSRWKIAGHVSQHSRSSPCAHTLVSSASWFSCCNGQ